MEINSSCTSPVNLPQIQQLTLKMLSKQRQVNFNTMLSLPTLSNRKDTIAIFRKGKYDSLITRQQVELLNNGRLHCSELWAEKYQSIVLRDSHIDSNLCTYRQNIKNNIRDYLRNIETHQDEQLQQMRKISSYNYKQLLKKNSSDSDEELQAIPSGQTNVSSFINDSLKLSNQNLKTKKDIVNKLDNLIENCKRVCKKSNYDTITQNRSVPPLKLKRGNESIISKKMNTIHMSRI